MASNRIGVIYLQRERFQLYSPMLPGILEFKFVPEIIRDLDIINRELFENIIKLFISNVKIPPSDLIIVIADNASFIQNFIKPNSSQQTTASQSTQDQFKNEKLIEEELHDQIKKFIEHTPFDSVASKTFPLNIGSRVVVVNKDLYESVKTAFETQGFIVNSVLPGLAFGESIGVKNDLDAATANFLLQKYNALNQYNFLKKDINLSEVKENIEGFEQPVNKKTNKRLIALVSIFVLLIGVLIIVYIMNTLKPTVIKSNAQQIPVATALPLTPTTTQDSTGTGNLLNPDEAKNLTIQIVNASTSARPALLLKEHLGKYSFKSIDIQTQGSSGSSNNIIIFSVSPSQALRSAVIEEVRKTVGEIQVQDKKEATFDIRIILGQ